MIRRSLEEVKIKMFTKLPPNINCLLKLDLDYVSAMQFHAVNVVQAWIELLM